MLHLLLFKDLQSVALDRCKRALEVWSIMVRWPSSIGSLNKLIRSCPVQNPWMMQTDLQPTVVVSPLVTRKWTALDRMCCWSRKWDPLLATHSHGLRFKHMTLRIKILKSMPISDLSTSPCLWLNEPFARFCLQRNIPSFNHESSPL